MNHPLLIYGANGFTAGLVVDECLRRGLRPILAGRNASKVTAAAELHGLPARVASLEARSLDSALEGVQVVLNAAGPFRATVSPLVRACIARGAHYVDVSGEVDAIAEAAAHGVDARRAGVMLLPAAGFDVVPSDCLCAHVIRRAPDAIRLRIALSGLELVSPGSLATLQLELGRAPRVLRSGRLRDLQRGEGRRRFDFGAGLRPCRAVSWGDLATAPYTTGVGDVEVYFEETPALALTANLRPAIAWFSRTRALDVWTGLAKAWLPAPTPERRMRARACIVVEAERPSGSRVASRLGTPEAYSLTASVATRVLERVLDGDVEAGFQTPGRLYGPHFISQFDGVTVEDLHAEASA